MATNQIMPEYLTDEDIAKFDAEQANAPEVLTDEDIAKFDAEQPIVQQPQQPPLQQAIETIVKTLATSPVVSPISPMTRVSASQVRPLEQAIDIQAPRLGEMAKEATSKITETRLSPQAEAILNQVLPAVAGQIPAQARGTGAIPAIVGKVSEEIPKLAKVTNLALMELGPGAKKSADESVAVIKQIPDKFFRGGLTKPEALRIEAEYGSSNGALVEAVKTKLNAMKDAADEAYKTAVNSFQGEAIDANSFFKALQQGLRDRKYVDLQGVPTNRFKSGLDPVMDKLTNMYVDLVNQPGIKGHVLSKEDFALYRDALGSMLKEKPSDVLVMQARNALYNSAEKSGMTGIKAARDLERQAIEKSKKFLDAKGDLKIANESKLSRIGTDKPLSQAELQHIAELEKYVDHSIIKDAKMINKLNRAKEFIKKAKERSAWGITGAVTGGLITKSLMGR